MKIVVFGASGKTGSLLVEEALESGHDIIAYVRKRESIKLKHPNLKVVTGLLNEKEKLTRIITGSDACISTLGGTSLMRHSLEIMEGIDNIVSIMEEKSATRLIYMSSLGAGESRYFMSQPARFIILDLMLRVAISDHSANEKCISRSKLDWTIVRPGGLNNGPKTGNLKYGSEKIKMKGSTSISRSNVASFLINQITESAYVNKSVWLHD